MCQMCMKLPAMFDQNPPHNFDKKSEKTDNNKNTLDLEPKFQGLRRNLKIMRRETEKTPKK